MMFGLINLYVLIWPGDILTTYAIAGAILYFFRNNTPNMLLVMAGVIILIMSLLYGGLNHVLQLGEQAAVQIELNGADSVSAEDLELAEAWQAFAEEYEFDQQALADELATRQSSYSTLFMANIEEANGMLLFVVPFITLWDALATMLIGMALFKLGVLQGERSTHFYLRMTLTGFSLGLLINIAEISNAINSGFHILSTFPFLLWSYHLGRIGMALGYLGLVALILQSGHLAALTTKFAAVGRTALSNYLLQSVLGLLIFSGLGLALFGELSRAQLYLVVALIWCLQLWLSNWWMTRYRYGPLEHLWRGLTYGHFVRNRR